MLVERHLAPGSPPMMGRRKLRSARVGISRPGYARCFFRIQRRSRPLLSDHCAVLPTGASHRADAQLKGVEDAITLLQSDLPKARVGLFARTR